MTEPELLESSSASPEFYDEVVTNLVLRVLLFLGMILLLGFFAAFGSLLYSVRPATTLQIAIYAGIPLTEATCITATYFLTRRDAWFWPRIVLIVVWAADMANLTLGARGVFGI